MLDEKLKLNKKLPLQLTEISKVMLNKNKSKLMEIHIYMNENTENIKR